VRLSLGCDGHEQRVDRRGREPPQADPLTQLIVEIGPTRLIPQVAIDGGASLRRAARELLRAAGFVGAFTACVDGLLEPEEQAVEIDRNDVGSLDGGERARVGQPAKNGGCERLR
jgi:hypothetical protein